MRSLGLRMHSRSRSRAHRSIWTEKAAASSNCIKATALDDTVVCGRALVDVNGRAYLYDPASGKSFPIPYCGFDIVRLVRETPNHVVFWARNRDDIDYWAADREAFAEGRMDETNTFRLVDRLVKQEENKQ